MATIFLVSEHIAKTSGLINKDHQYFWDGETYYEAQEYVDGSYPVNSEKFCSCCRSNNCNAVS